jgi:hypothetical protein
MGANQTRTGIFIPRGVVIELVHEVHFAIYVVLVLSFYDALHSVSHLLG